ncbi:MAG: quinone oxidoreductase, partial [Hyphomicrobium sp.]|nr:quinone oxidoreductase [Hyphomicrobium sp.]
LPAVIGMEGAGVVEAVGPGVAELKVGDRVAYAGVLGAYADERLVPADRLVRLPDDIDDVTAASMMLQGMTARYLLRETYRCTAETVLLFHAAAGGVGLIVCQWAKAIGATMIGTVGSDEKAQLATAAGCTHAINYRTEDYVKRVREITGGIGCDVVYDGVGKDTFPSSLDCLRPKGLWVSFGNASGAVPPFDMQILSAKGSLYATRPTVMTYTARREELLANAAELFGMVSSGAIEIVPSRTYPLREAAQAHRDLEARKTTGSIVLIP